MWWEILCGLVIYRIIRSCFSDDDEFSDFDTSDSDLIFSVADKLEKIYGGKAFIGLRIPDADADAGTRRDIDIVLVTKQEAMVVAVKNLSGFVTVNKEGSWACTGGKKHKAEVLPDPVEEIGRQVAVLESYLEQRGVALPEGFLGCKLILPNPKCMITHSIDVLPEVISYDKWTQLKSETKGGLSGWFKGAFRGGKNGLQDATYQKLHFTLGTAPMWDSPTYQIASLGKKNPLRSATHLRSLKATKDMVEEPPSQPSPTADVGGLIIANNKTIHSFLISSAEDLTLDGELRGLASRLASESTVPYKSLRRIWSLTPSSARPGLLRLFSSSDFVLPSPKPREKSEELKERLRKLSEMVERRAYEELVRDVVPKKEVGEPFSSYKDQLGFGLHVVLTMFTGFLVGYAAFRALFNHNPILNVAGGIFGLVCGMLLETVLFIIKTSNRNDASSYSASNVKKSQ